MADGTTPTKKNPAKKMTPELRAQIASAKDEAMGAIQNVLSGQEAVKTLEERAGAAIHKLVTLRGKGGPFDINGRKVEFRHVRDSGDPGRYLVKDWKEGDAM